MLPKPWRARTVWAQWPCEVGCRVLTPGVAGGVPVGPSAGASVAAGPSVWAVGRLMLAVADALSARFNPVRVRGELSGWTRAASGHCYFTLKDDTGQVRCAMFRRSAASLAFSPRDGDSVEVQGKLDVYGPRGDLQLIADAMRPVGQGNLYEQFVQLKARLQGLGWFDAARKKPVPVMPRSIGVVTSLGAAALRDVATALARRVPHIPVTVFPAAVQGVQAPAELVAALACASELHARTGHPEVLLLVRGGGSLEDLWAFNAESVAQALVQAPMPVVCGVGHESDFTIADFVCDLRAPTPTAAAELCATDRDTALSLLVNSGHRLGDAVLDRIDAMGQRLDRLGQRLSRPSDRVVLQRHALQHLSHRLDQTMKSKLQQQTLYIQAIEANFPEKMTAHLQALAQRLAHHKALLDSMDPRLVLHRGYAWLADGSGHAITSVSQVSPGQAVQATLADGEVDLLVR